MYVYVASYTQNNCVLRMRSTSYFGGYTYIEIPEFMILYRVAIASTC